MTGIENTVFLFSNQILSFNALEWSKDNRIAISTDKGILIMEPQHSPQQAEKKILCYQSYISSPTTQNNLTGWSLAQFKDFCNGFKDITEEEHQELYLDRTLNPYKVCSVTCTAYKSPKWSPLHADELGRCILATLTTDHRLVLYSSLNTHRFWTKVAEISDMYSKQFRDEFKSDISFQTYRSLCFQMSAVDVSWSPAVNSDKSMYSLLAVAMKSGDVILWKINFPVKSESDCQFLRKIEDFKSVPSVMSWSDQKDSDTHSYLLLGFHSGKVVMSTMTTKTGDVASTVQLHDVEDGMSVTCLQCKAVSQNQFVVLATKEYYVMSFLLEANNDTVTVLHSTHTTADHNYNATGLVLRDNYWALSSFDAYIQKIQPHFDNNEMRLEFSTLTPQTQNQSRLYGLGISKHAIFLVITVWLNDTYDHRPFVWKPLQVIFQPLEDKEYLQNRLTTLLLDESEIHIPGDQSRNMFPLGNPHCLTYWTATIVNIPCSEIPDVLELFRQYILTGYNPVPSVTKHISDPMKWYSLPLKILRVMRYFLLVIKSCPPESTDEENNWSEVDKNLLKLGQIIIIKCIESCCDQVLHLNETLTSKEIQILHSMVTWLQTQEEWYRGTPLEEKIKDVMKKLGDTPTQSTCCICDEALMIDGLTFKCSNGHTFGMCCKTTLPCTVPDRVCIVCNTLAVSSEYLDDVRWLPKQPCTLCGGMLLCKDIVQG